MSFLEEMIAKRKSLKSVETVTTSLLGCKFIEKTNESGEIIGKKVLEMCSGFVVDNKLDLQVAQVLSYLYLGSQDPAQDVDILEKHGITHVLSVGVDLLPSNACKIKFFKVHLLDEPNVDISDALNYSFEIIRKIHAENKENKIFVHCNAGYSRGPTIVLGYLMRAAGMSLEEALKMVNDVRKVKPNGGFLKQLKQLEKKYSL